MLSILSSVMFAALTTPAIEATVRTHLGDVEACYAPVAERDPSVQGRIRLQWTLAQNGAPTAVAILEDTLPTSAVASCLKEKARHWRFPPTGAGTAVVAYTFVLAMH